MGNLRVACRCAEQIETAQTNRNADRPEIGYAPTVVQQAHYDPWGVKLPMFSVGEASFDAATDFVAGRVGGAVAKKLGSVTENFAKKMAANSNVANQALSIAENAAKEAPKNSGYSTYAKVLAKEANVENAKKQGARVVTKAVGAKATNTVNEGVQNVVQDKAKEKVKEWYQIW